MQQVHTAGRRARRHSVAFPVIPVGSGASAGLTWWDHLGMGHYPVRSHVYDDAYWRKYEEYAVTDLGRALTRARIALVERHVGAARLCDIGIGSGQFVEERNRVAAGSTVGYDVNPRGVSWLLRAGLFHDPWRDRTDVVTFWDSLEHIHDIGELLDRIGAAAFVSIPIFRDRDHVLASRHFRPDEHVWYFTRAGLLGYMEQAGFRCVEENAMESELGREDIGSFAFIRVARGCAAGSRVPAGVAVV